MRKIPRLTDTTLRDGDHAINHSYSPEMVKAIVNDLDDARFRLSKSATAQA